jgi:osmoprotectant transport system ATP-binding protein
VLQEGGKLAQFAAPAELLMHPASRFVEDFVGADRALKRLALQRVRDIDLWKAVTCQVGESTSAVRAGIGEADIPYPLLVDDQQRPLGWLSERGMAGERVMHDLRSNAEPVVELDDILRDALSDLLARDSLYGPVVDHRGHVVGVLSMKVISHTLTTDPEGVPSAAELVGAGDAADTAP